MGGKIFKFERYANKSENARPVWISSEDKENGPQNCNTIGQRFPEGNQSIDANAVKNEISEDSEALNEPDSMSSIPDLAIVHNDTLTAVKTEVNTEKHEEAKTNPETQIKKLPVVPTKPPEVPKTTVLPGHVINPKLNKPIPVDFGPEPMTGRKLVLMENTGIEGTRVIKLDPSQEIYDKQVLMKFKGTGKKIFQVSKYFTNQSFAGTT